METKTKLKTGRLARASARHPWRTVAAWVLIIVAAMALSSTLLGDALTSTGDFTNRPENKVGQELLEERLTGPERITEIVIVRSDQLRADQGRFQTVVDAIAADIRALGADAVDSVVGPFDGPQPLVSPDGDTALIQVTMAGDFDDAKEHVEALHDVTLHREGLPAGFTVNVAGRATIDVDAAELSERDLRTGEGIGLPIAILVLIAVFGAIVAALVPVVLAIAGIIVAVGLTALIGQAFSFSFFVVNMITMMGLAVGIDYSLFVVSRYKEERARGRDTMDAIEVAGATATRAVFFSGATVILALLGMFLIPTTVFRSLAAGAILVVMTSVAASMTLLPAVMKLLGSRIDKGRIKWLRRDKVDAIEKTGGFWDRSTRAVMRRPVISLVLAGGLLLAAAVPVLDMEIGFAGVSTMPDDLQSKEAFTVLSEEFAGGLAEPAKIVVDGPAEDPAVRQGVRAVRESLAEQPIFGPSDVVRAPSGDLTLIKAPLAGDPFAGDAVDAVRALRADVIPAAFEGAPAEVYVTGQTGWAIDFFDLTDTYTPIVFVFVLGLSFLLLMVVFRSLVVPAKAILMNLLSVGAAYGLVVLVQQKGYGASFFGFTQTEKIEAWLPLFLFSVLFGLSMDYHVFLLSRIRERYDQTRDNTESVAFGVRSTAGIITGAALIMVAVFSGFALGEMTSMQQTGFGLGIAVLLDATIVRSVLVPASMRLLGDRNWYLPSWLEWLPHVSVEAAEPMPVVAAASATPVEPVADRTIVLEPEAPVATRTPAKKTASVATKSSAAKRKATPKKSATKRAPSKSTAAKRTAAKRTAAKRAPAKRAPAKRAPAKRANGAATKATTKRAPAKRTNGATKKAAAKRKPAAKNGAAKPRPRVKAKPKAKAKAAKTKTT